MPITTIRRLRLRHAPSGSFAAHVLTLMTGTTIAQAIPVAIAPILTRLYTPKEFGVFALFTSLVAMPAIIVTGRYELAIMLPDDDKDAAGLLALSILISISLSILTLLTVWLLNKQIASLLGDLEIAPWLYWVPFSVFLTGIYQSLNYWLSRKKQYKRLAVSRIYQSVSAASSNLVLGFGGIGASGLIGGNMIGQGFGSAVLLSRVWQDYKVVKRELSIEVVRANAVKYRDFPLINSLHALLDVVQTSGVAFVISIYFGSVVLGFYSLTLSILRAPLNFLGSSVSQVFYQNASETCRIGGDLHKLTRNTMLKLSLVAFPFFLLFFLLAPDMFKIVFGINWEIAGRYTQILSPWLFINFIISPVSQIPIILNRQKTGFAIGFVYNMAILVSLLLAAYLGKGIVAGLYLLSISASIVLICYIGWILRISRNKSGTLCNYA